MALSQNPHSFAHFGSEHIYGHQGGRAPVFRGLLEMPICPAITSRGFLDVGTHFVDGTAGVWDCNTAVGAYPCRDATIWRIQGVARIDHAALDQNPKCHTGQGPLGRGDFEGDTASGLDFVDAALGVDDIFFFALIADEIASEFFGYCARSAGTKKRINTISPGLVVDNNTRCNRLSGFWVGWAFVPSDFLMRSRPVHMGRVQSDRI